MKKISESNTTSSKFFEIHLPIFKIESDKPYYDFSEGKTTLDKFLARVVTPYLLATSIIHRAKMNSSARTTVDIKCRQRIRIR